MNKNRRRPKAGETRDRWILRIQKAVDKINELLYHRHRLLGHLRSILAILLALGVLSAVIYLLVDQIDTHVQHTPIHTIEYESRGYITEQQALALLKIEPKAALSSLNIEQLNRDLQAQPCIKRGSVTIKLPDTLSIQIEERLPLCYVERAQGVITGERERYFISDDGTIFPNIREYYADFQSLPIWYVNPRDYEQFAVNKRITASALRPILETLTAVSRYELKELPAIREILRPKAWKTQLILETGTEVTMSVMNIDEQIKRLVMILKHARSSRLHPRSINIIPKLNPTVIYAPQ